VSSTESLTPYQTDRAGSLWYRLSHGATNYEFVRRWKRWLLISGTVIVIGLVSLAARGLSLGIDFKGGTSWEFDRKSLTVAQARDVVGPLIGRDAPIQLLGADRMRVKGAKSDEVTRTKVADALAKAAKIDRKNLSTNFVGPTWGKDVSRKALIALLWFFVVITAYISIRFQFKMAIAALVAVFHDVIVTVGIYSVIGGLFGIEVTPATVIAFLTILGFSLYDTIVVFDKVADNEKTYAANGKLAFTDVVNLSMNQTLMRSINTSFVAILPVLSLLIVGAGIMGAVALGDFGLALFIGLLTGAYSSIFVASPLLALLKEREESWTKIRTKLARGGDSITAEAGAAARDQAAHSGVVVAADPLSAASVFGGVPRGRKQGKAR
jgi:preprotein translocase subunit SecF